MTILHYPFHLCMPTFLTIGYGNFKMSIIIIIIHQLTINGIIKLLLNACIFFKVNYSFKS